MVYSGHHKGERLQERRSIGLLLPATTSKRLGGHEKQLHSDPRDREDTLNQLVAYLLDNLILDFQGDLTLDMVRDFLREDDTRESKALLTKLVEDRGVSEMLICIADCLRDYISSGIKPDNVRDQLHIYAES